MTKNEAIEMAIDRVRQGLHFDHNIKIEINDYSGITYTNLDTGFCDHFSFDKPRPIPKKGTPVISTDGTKIGFSSGEVDSKGWLGVSHDKDNADMRVAEFLLKDWNVLVRE
jgi:hypothetical protein